MEKSEGTNLPFIHKRGGEENAVPRRLGKTLPITITAGAGTDDQGGE